MIRFVENFEYNGITYKIEYAGISYRCEQLKIFGEKDILSVKRSIKKKVNKGLKK